jgi:hypothetical protein
MISKVNNIVINNVIAKQRGPMANSNYIVCVYSICSIHFTIHLYVHRDRYAAATSATPPCHQPPSLFIDYTVANKKTMF